MTRQFLESWYEANLILLVRTSPVATGIEIASNNATLSKSLCAVLGRNLFSNCDGGFG